MAGPEARGDGAGASVPLSDGEVTRLKMLTVHLIPGHLGYHGGAANSFWPHGAFRAARFTVLCRRAQAGGNREPVERLSPEHPDKSLASGLKRFLERFVPSWAF
jgi:hypothetical protein